MSTYQAGGSIEQFDLSSGIPATIIASQTNVAFVTDVYALQSGPDGKIYVCKSFNSHLGVISAPNALAPACNFVDNLIDLDPNFNGVTSALGLPGFVQSFVGTVEDCLPTAISRTNSSSADIIYPNPSSEYFTLIFSRKNEPSEIFVINNLSQVIERFTFQMENIVFGQNYSPGIYSVLIKSGNDFKVMRAVKIK